MAGQGAWLRPYTFFARLPRGVTNVDLCKIMVQRFTRSELRGLQDFTRGKFEVSFSTKAAVDRFLADSVVEIQEQKVRFEYRGSRVKIVRVFHYPVEDPEEELKHMLGAYGQVYAIQRESVPGFPEMYSGTHRVRMEMLKDVPNILKVQDRCVVRCEYEGVVGQCIRCGGTGHHAAACTTAKCKRCEQFRHEDCDTPCSNCQADNARSACRVRSFTRVVGQAPNSLTEEIVPVSEPEAKSAEQNASDAKDSSADSRDTLDSAACEEDVRAREQTKNVVGAFAITNALAPFAVGEAAAVAPPLAAEGNPSEAANAAASPVEPSAETPKRKRRKRSKRKLFVEEKEVVSKTGLRKVSDSEDKSTLSATRSPARQKRAVSPTGDSSNSEEEFSSTDDDQMESEQGPQK